MSKLPRRLGHGEEAPLDEHLEELRQRLFVIIGAVVAGTVVAYIFHGHLLHWLNQPLPPGHRKLLAIGVAEPFTVTLTVCIYAGIVLASPVILWQIWGFFAPAFDRTIERKILVLVAAAAVLAAAGVAFGYWILLPRALRWLTSYDSVNFLHLIQAKAYYSFVTTVMLGMVVIFQTPLVILGLVSIGVLSSRTLRKHRRLGYFITAAVALALPGPDFLTTFLELLPMWLLFEASIWLAVLLERRKGKIAPASATLGG